MRSLHQEFQFFLIFTNIRLKRSTVSFLSTNPFINFFPLYICYYNWRNSRLKETWSGKFLAGRVREEIKVFADVFAEEAMTALGLSLGWAESVEAAWEMGKGGDVYGYVRALRFRMEPHSPKISYLPHTYTNTTLRKSGNTEGEGNRLNFVPLDGEGNEELQGGKGEND